ncbi:MAG: translocation/assembly module TamB domain-containing protein [Flammeovirgaceae bacterium]
MQFPFIQTKLGEYGTKELSKSLGYPIVIERIAIDWFDEIKLQGVSIKDPQKKPIIEVNDLRINYRFHTLLKSGNVHLERVTLNSAMITLVQMHDSLNIDGFINAIDRLTASKDSVEKSSSDGEFQIAKITLRNTRFSYTDPHVSPEADPTIFDPSNFLFNYINADITNFRVMNDTIQMDISGLKTIEEKTSISLTDLTTFLRYCKKGVDLYGISGNLGNSLIRDTIELRYNHPSEFANFNEKIRLNVHFRESVLDFSDFSKFNQSLKNYSDVLKISGNLRGTVSDLLLDSVDIEFGTGSTLKGDMRFVGLPNIDSTFLDFELDDTFLKSEDLLQYAPVSAQETIAKLGQTKLKASLSGYLNDLDIKGDFQTAIGFVKTDLIIKSDSEEYKGFLETQDFDIGLLSGTSSVGKLGIKGNFTGKGFSLDNANLTVNAHISRLGLMGYDYTNIRLDSSYLQRKRFKGFAKIDDPNLKLNLRGDINFEDSTFKFTVKIDTAQLHKLNIISDSIAFSTTIKADFEGLTPDQVIGKLRIEDSRLIYKGKPFALSNFDINTYKDINRVNRTLLIRSDLFNLMARGNFEFMHLLDDGTRLAKEFMLDIWESDSLMNAYYTQKAIEFEKKRIEGNLKPDSLRQDQDYKITFAADAPNINRLFKFLDKKIYIAKGTSIKGSFGAGKKTLAEMTIKSDTLFFGNNHFFNNQLKFYGTKEELNRRFNIEFALSSAFQSLGKQKLKDLMVEGYRLEENFFISANIKNAQSSDYVDLQTYVTIFDDRYEIFIHDTKFQFLEQVWSNLDAGKNKIIYKNNELFFEEVGFKSGNQSIRFEGVITDDKKRPLYADIQNFDLKILEPYIHYKLGGLLTSEAILRNLGENPQIESYTTIKNLSIDNIVFGNIFTETSWEDALQQLILNAVIEKNEVPLLRATGSYSPNAPENSQILMEIVFNGTQMAILEPFVKDNVSHLGGTINGLVEVRGSFSDLILKGEAYISDGTFKVNYLNTYYTFSDKIKFNSRSITVKKFKLFDTNQNFALLEGGLVWGKKKGYEINLKADFKEFMVMNTTRKDNPIFYGTAIGTGNLKVKGAINNVLVKVNAKSEKNTKIYMPLTETEDIEEQNFIKYVVKKDTLLDTFTKNSDEEELGFTLDLNIEVTPDAYCEIIFDKKTGDIIRGNGKGKVQILMNNTGDFSMYGDVEILKGAYNFTMMNLVDKRFDVLPNSTISWSGDPFGGKMNVTAAYSQPASLVPIITTADSSFIAQPEVRRRYPVKVLLNLQGGFFNPQISFGIKISDYPQSLLRTYVEAFERKIEVDEQELNRQVFSLIVLKKLSPEQRFAGVENAAGNSVSELLTNQLSYWLSQVDDKLEIDVNLAGLTADALSAMQVRLSYSFMEGRLRITRDGNFTNSSNQADIGSVVGNWTVEYMIRQDGTVRLKLFHRNNLNVINSSLGSTTTTGMSLMHTKSFRSFRDLFKRKKKTTTSSSPSNENYPEENELQENIQNSIDNEPNEINLSEENVSDKTDGN